LTTSTDFPTASPIQASRVGAGDVFITKVNAAGSALVYSTYLGGSGTGGSADIGYGIAVDGAGNAYVIGGTTSINFPTASPFQASNSGSADAFFLKVNAAGSALVYSSYLGGLNTETGRGIAVDGTGNAYLTGFTASLNFPTANPIQPALSGGIDFDAFVTKVNAAGSALVYSTYLGGGMTEEGHGIAVDGAGNAYVTGRTSSTNFPTVAPFQTTNAGILTDAFVAKINAAGSTLLYSSYLGGPGGISTGHDEGNGIAVDGAGNAYLVGMTTSPSFPTTPLSVQPASGGNGEDAWVARVSPNDSIGLYDPATGVFFLRNSNNGGAANAQFGYGPGGLGWIPLAGDWNGDRLATVGVYNPASSTFYLRNSNTGGPADVVVNYGPPAAGWIPVVGDWDGNGTDTVGVFDPAASVFYLRNSNTAGPADIVFAYGPAGANWIPIVGDWDVNNTDTIGLYNQVAGNFYLRNSNSAGPADALFWFGPMGANWVPMAGDWDGNGVDTIGLYNPTTSVFYLRNQNNAGIADIIFGYGPAGLNWAPRAGNWDGE
jgi:hypothetical protein